MKRICLKCGKETPDTPCPYCGSEVFRVESFDYLLERFENLNCIRGQQVLQAKEDPELFKEIYEIKDKLRKLFTFKETGNEKLTK
jgi:hypothetical protein